MAANDRGGLGEIRPIDGVYLDISFSPCTPPGSRRVQKVSELESRSRLDGPVITKATQMRAAFDQNGLAGKPMFQTEGSWGNGSLRDRSNYRASGRRGTVPRLRKPEPCAAAYRTVP